MVNEIENGEMYEQLLGKNIVARADLADSRRVGCYGQRSKR